MIDLTLLGEGGYMPLPSRHLTACALRSGGFSALIDCGEGTQLAMREASQSFKSISAILLTHFHADHIAGLPGLLLSMGNEGREAPVDLFGPDGLDRIIAAVRTLAPELPFELALHPLPQAETEFEAGPFRITAFPLDHRIPCLGYRIHLPRTGRFSVEKARQNGVPMELWSELQKNSKATLRGVTYTSDMVLGLPRQGLSVLYATDSRPVPAISRLGQDADLLILEGMYADPEKLPRCIETRHMLATEAASLARDAGARALWLTHFSPAQKDPEEAAAAAREIFPQTEAGTGGKRILLRFPEQD